MVVGILTNGANMKHSVILRFWFDDVSGRLGLLRGTLQSLEEQSDRNFTVYIICKEHHAKQVQDLTCLTLQFIHYEMPKNDMGYISPFSISHEADIQTRIDCDDLVDPEFIRYVNSRYNDESVLYAFVPDKIYKGKYYKMGKVYTEKKTPMFLSLTNPKVFIYSDSHIRMWKYADRVELVYGMAWMNIHDNNARTKLNHNDTLI